MPHQRHRTHNVRDQHAERNIRSDRCGVVISGERIFVRGRVGYTIHPVFSEVIVKGLARPEMLMEIDVEVVRSS